MSHYIEWYIEASQHLCLLNQSVRRPKNVMRSITSTGLAHQNGNADGRLDWGTGDDYRGAFTNAWLTVMD